MPKNTKCWYNGCDSDSGADPQLLFYKFPRDLGRCEKWVKNCANNELTSIWNENPEKLSTHRICQRHFLKEFLGFSSRLVGHAVPAPFGVPIEQLDAERFMVNCANSKSMTSLVRPTNCEVEPLQTYQQQDQQQLYEPIPYYESSHITYNQEMVTATYSNCDTTGQNTNYQSCSDNVNQNSYQQVIDHNQQATSELRTYLNLDQHNHQEISYVDPTNDCHQCSTPLDRTSLSTPPLESVVASSYQADNIQATQNSLLEAQPQAQVPQVNEVAVLQPQELVTQPQPTRFTEIDENYADICSPSSAGRSNNFENPRINYDRQGKVVNIQYANDTLSLIKADDKERDKAHIEALKHKVRFYQRKLAVKTHRYQNLKSLTRTCSNKTRLLESLKTCKADFDPCVFELFKRQVKGPSSKQGNRWPDEVKSFSSNIYLRSKSAYKFVRKTIDLPSETIVKRYIGEKNLSRLVTNDLDDESDRKSG